MPKIRGYSVGDQFRSLAKLPGQMRRTRRSQRTAASLKHTVNMGKAAARRRVSGTKARPGRRAY